MNVIMLFVLSLSVVFAKDYLLNSDINLERLLILDTNKDKKITVDDNLPQNAAFDLALSNGKKVKIKGVYFLSNLLQELKLGTENSTPQDVIADHLIFENPVERISRLIRHMYWNGLTRRIDREHLQIVLPDPKIKSDINYLYVPDNDLEALTYFSKAAKEMPQLKMKVRIVPKKHAQLKNKHGLLALKIGVPYVVPGGRFNETYGWDSYFEALGLINDHRLDLAQAMVDNQVYEIDHYGKILNANRTYYLGRSQPPFLTSMIRAVYEAIPKKDRSKDWLRSSLKAAIKEYQTVWMGKDRLTESGLSRYFGTSQEVPPEVEPGHFDEIYKPYAQKRKLSIREFEHKYKEKQISEPELDLFFVHDQAVRESGHDTTYRWRKNDQDKCADFVTVDLNSLLYKIELDIAYLIKHEFQDHFEGASSLDFYQKARMRKELIRKLLWDKSGMFSDYDVVDKKRSGYVSASAFYPLWAYEPSDKSTRILTEPEANLLVNHLLKALEAPGGLISTSLASLQHVGGKLHERQWDYPNGWAPHQMLAWKGLRNYGFNHLADRLTYKWLYMITLNAMNYNGTIPEKYDVVNKTHKVFAEYGNVGTKFAYITKEGFGWMNASYQVGLKSLAPSLKNKLIKLIPPEDL